MPANTNIYEPKLTNNVLQRKRAAVSGKGCLG